MQKRRTRIVLVSIAALSLFAAGARAAQDGGKAEDGARGKRSRRGCTSATCSIRATGSSPRTCCRRRSSSTTRTASTTTHRRLSARQAHWEKSFLEATEKNAGQLDVDDARHRSSTRAPASSPTTSTAFPFPIIDPNDPKAAVKIVWNQFLAYWSGGSSYNVTLVAMLQPKGIDREHPRRRLVPLLRRPDARSTASRTRSTCRASSSASSTYPDRSAGHGVAHLALPRSRQARLGVGLRAGAAARARGQPGEPLRRLPGLRHQRRRRLLLRRQAGGLRLEADRQARRAAHRRSRLGGRHRARSPPAPGRRLGGADRRQPADGRLRGPELDGRLVGADRRRPRQAPGVGRSRRRRRTSTTSTARSSCGSTPRPGTAPGTASSAGRASSCTTTRSWRASTSRPARKTRRRVAARQHAGVGLRRELQDEPRHPRRHARRPASRRSSAAHRSTPTSSIRRRWRGTGSRKCVS